MVRKYAKLIHANLRGLVKTIYAGKCSDNNFNLPKINLNRPTHKPKQQSSCTKKTRTRTHPLPQPSGCFLSNRLWLKYSQTTRRVLKYSHTYKDKRTREPDLLVIQIYFVVAIGLLWESCCERSIVATRAPACVAWLCQFAFICGQAAFSAGGGFVSL